MNKTIFVTTITGSLRRGGAENQLSLILPLLDKNRFKLEIFLLTTVGDLASELEEKGVKVIRPWFDTGANNISIIKRIFRYFVTSFQLFLYLVKNRPNIVHFVLPQSYCFAMPTCMLAMIRTRIMSRLSLNDYQKNRPVLARYEKYLHRFTQKIIVNSEAIRQQLMSVENVSDNKINTIYSGVDMSGKYTIDNANIRDKYGIDREDIMFVIIANLISYKGHADLLNALSIAADDLPDKWHILIVGRDDGIGDDLKASAKKNGIAEHCIFIGHVNNTSDYMSSADIGILTSHQEGFSVSIVEGMRSKLPMIVTDVGGNREAVVDGVTGYVIPARDIEKLASVIIKLANDAKLRTKMGEEAYARVSRLFSIEECVSQYEKLYAGIAC